MLELDGGPSRLLKKSLASEIVMCFFRLGRLAETNGCGAGRAVGVAV